MNRMKLLLGKNKALMQTKHGPFETLLYSIYLYVGSAIYYNFRYLIILCL